MNRECRVCNKEKNLELFTKCNKSLNGRTKVCKSCNAAKHKEYRNSRPEKTKMIQKKSQEKRNNSGKQKEYEQSRRHNDSYKERMRREAHKRYYSSGKAKTRIITNRAIKNGKIVKQCCYQCSSSENLEAHHENYDLPLEVVWLCRPCHRSYHRRCNENLY
jgi:hypothetical protein